MQDWGTVYTDTVSFVTALVLIWLHPSFTRRQFEFVFKPGCFENAFKLDRFENAFKSACVNGRTAENKEDALNLCLC